MTDVFVDPGAHQRFMAVWSRRAARPPLVWLAAPAPADWVDAGRGTGASTAAVLGRQGPARVLRLDPCAVVADDGSIRLTAGAGAVRGRRPPDRAAAPGPAG